MSSREIAALFGATDATVRKWARDAGIARSASEAHVLRAAKMTAAERLAQSAAAHDAVRGRHVPAEELEARAVTRERLGLHVGTEERRLARLLRKRGVATRAQQAEGPVNIDLATGSVAVEVFGGGFHGAGRHLARHPRRCRYLLDRGWSVVVIWIDKRREFALTGAADYVVALLDEFRRSPALVRQYRVIRSDGEELVRGCAKDDDFPVKRPRVAKLAIRCKHQR